MLDNQELWNKYINDELDEISDDVNQIKKLEHKRIVFCGTPKIAKHALQALMEIKEFEIVAVVCQPDKELNRKKEIIFQPVKKFALEHNLKILQPEKIQDVYDELITLNIDAIITCAYGQFIPTSILEIPKEGCYNLHASLLPKYRGGAPIHWAIINGESKTGWTLMKMVKTMDAGDYCDQMVCEIDENETMTDLYNKLCDLLEPFILFYLPRIFDSETKWIKQDETQVTFAYNITKSDRYIDFNLDAKKIYDKIRGLNNKPIALWGYKNCEIKVYESKIFDKKTNDFKPGEIISFTKDGLRIATSTNDIIITQLQLPNKDKVNISQIYHNQFYKDFFVNKNEKI